MGKEIEWVCDDCRKADTCTTLCDAARIDILVILLRFEEKQQDDDQLCGFVEYYLTGDESHLKGGTDVLDLPHSSLDAIAEKIRHRDEKEPV